MFGLLKFLFFTFVAVVVGVVIGTVPIGGQTVAERIAAVYQPGSSIAPAKKAPPKAAARTAPRPKVAQASVAVPTPSPAPAKPVTAGAANAPDGHTEGDKMALDKLIASRAKAK